MLVDDISKPFQQEKSGYGKGQFTLGDGKEGTFGHIALFIQFVPEPAFCAVEWRVNNCDFANEARNLVETAVLKYLHNYLTKYPNYGLRVAIVEVISDEVRHNDYERAVNLAFRAALENISLPVPQIFGL